MELLDCVQQESEVKDVIVEAVASKRPTVIDFVVEREEKCISNGSSRGCH